MWGKRGRRRWFGSSGTAIPPCGCWLRVWLSEELPDSLWLPQACRTGLRETLSCQREAAPGAALLSSLGHRCESAVFGRQNPLHNPQGPALSLSAGQLWESSETVCLCVKAMWLTMSDQSCLLARTIILRVSVGADYLWKRVNILGKSMGQKPWTMLCAHTISRDDIGRGALLLVWNLALMHHSKENSWNLQARSCGEISNSSSLTGDDLYRSGPAFLRNCWWWMVGGSSVGLFHWKREAFQTKKVRCWEFLAGVCAPGCLLPSTQILCGHSGRGGYLAWGVYQGDGTGVSFEQQSLSLVLVPQCVLDSNPALHRWEPGETL